MLELVSSTTEGGSCTSVSDAIVVITCLTRFFGFQLFGRVERSDCWTLCKAEKENVHQPRQVCRGLGIIWVQTVSQLEILLHQQSPVVVAELAKIATTNAFHWRKLVENLHTNAYIVLALHAMCRKEIVAGRIVGDWWDTGTERTPRFYGKVPLSCMQHGLLFAASRHFPLDNAHEPMVFDVIRLLP